MHKLDCGNLYANRDSVCKPSTSETALFAHANELKFSQMHDGHICVWEILAYTLVSLLKPATTHSPDMAVTSKQDIGFFGPPSTRLVLGHL